MKKTILTGIFSLFISYNAIGGLEDYHWEAIAAEIASAGTADNMSELDMAIQALRNIKEPASALSAARKIADKWNGKKVSFWNHKTNKYEEITIDKAKKKAGEQPLVKDLKRYPEMSADEVKAETKYVVRKYQDNLLKESGVNCTIT
jgi:hypothetical protein